MEFEKNQERGKQEEALKKIRAIFLKELVEKNGYARVFPNCPPPKPFSQFEITFDRYEELIKKEVMFDAIARFASSHKYITLDFLECIGAISNEKKEEKDELKS